MMYRQHLRSAATGTLLVPRARAATFWTTKVRNQRTISTEPSATRTTVTRPVAERLQAGAKNAPVLDRLEPSRLLRTSFLPYLLAYLLVNVYKCDIF